MHVKSMFLYTFYKYNKLCFNIVLHCVMADKGKRRPERRTELKKNMHKNIHNCEYTWVENAFWRFVKK